MAGEMVKPYAQDIFLNAIVVEVLSAAIGENHEIKMNSDGDGFADATEVGHVLGEMHGATQKHELTDSDAALIREHGNAPIMTVCEEI
jgi:hypothetical protein